MLQLSYHLSLRSLFYLFLNDRFTQGLLYTRYCCFGVNDAVCCFVDFMTQTDAMSDSIFHNMLGAQQTNKELDMLEA